MKQLMMLLVCLALVIPSVGCCWTHGCGYGAGYGGGCPGGACGATPYGYAPGYPTGAYYGGTTTTAGVGPITPYAAAPVYPTTAGVMNPLPTY